MTMIRLKMRETMSPLIREVIHDHDEQTAPSVS